MIREKLTKNGDDEEDRKFGPGAWNDKIREEYRLSKKPKSEEPTQQIQEPAQPKQVKILFNDKDGKRITITDETNVTDLKKSRDDLENEKKQLELNVKKGEDKAANLRLTHISQIIKKIDARLTKSNGIHQY